MHSDAGHCSNQEFKLFAQEENQTESCLDLFTAATLQDDAFHLVLLRNMANINKQNRSGWTMLMYASQSGNVQAVKLLLQFKADERICNSNRQTAVMLASAFGQEEVLSLLATPPSVINQLDDKGWPALMYAIFFSHIEAAKYLIQKGADVNFVDPSSGQSLLMIAAADMSVCGVLLPFLIARGADHANIAKELREKYDEIANHLRNPFSNQGQDQQAQSLQELLHSMDMDIYIPLFEEKQVDFERFMKLTEQDLKHVGVRLLGPRKRMAAAIQDYLCFQARSKLMEHHCL